jgi:hypothetical protein
MDNFATLEQARAAKARVFELFSALAAVVGVGITRVDGGYGVSGGPLLLSNYHVLTNGNQCRESDPIFRLCGGCPTAPVEEIARLVDFLKLRSQGSNFVDCAVANGDSGALVVDGGRLATALLFAGSDTGGSTGLGVTYANPLPRVLNDLGAELLV